MYRYVVITDPDTAPGFRLTGVEVVESAEEDVPERFEACLRDPEVGLVALNDRFLPALPVYLRDHVEQSSLPVVVPFPDPRGAPDASGEGEEHLHRVIQRAIGYRIRLRA